VADDPKIIRVRLDEPVLSEWADVLASHKISGQQAVAAVLAWMTKQDPLTRAMIFGQVPEMDNAALTRIVLKRLADAGGKGTPAK
jgi:hypothetical protein